MPAKHSLGRGLGALLQDSSTSQADRPDAGIQKVPIDKVHKSPWQARRSFDESALQELADSVRARGVVQPLLVRSTKKGYELIAGERRLRAAVAAGLSVVPVIEMDVADGDAAEIALVENLQREDLNILEEAEGYRMLSTKFGLTQEKIASRVGKSRASVTNALRILSLPDEVKGYLSDGTLQPGHAKLLAGLATGKEQLALARRTVKENLSVRNLEKAIQSARGAQRKRRVSKDDLPANHLRSLSDRLHRHFGTSVKIRSCTTLANGRKGRGSIEIEFYSDEDLDRILELLGLPPE